jgi:large subunit ribosomal protein L30
MADLRITQTRSPIGHRREARAALQTLGLRKIRQSVVRPDSPALRGQLRVVAHLVSVEEESS